MLVVVILLVVAAVVAFFVLRKPSQGSSTGASTPPSVEPSAKPSLPSRPAPKAAPSAQEQAVSLAPDSMESAAPPPRRPREKRALAEKRDISSLRAGLTQSRSDTGFFGRIKGLLSKKTEIDSSLAAEIEEILIASDVGVTTTATILERVRAELDRADAKDASKVWATLRAEMQRILDLDGQAQPVLLPAKPTVMLMVGVNGAGKTTTIGKLAGKLKAEGHTVVLAAADTFRAAAVQQLKIWGSRIGCEVVSGKEGADPASVVFDAIRKAQETGATVVLADTAGRLHTKVNLMTEMQKIGASAGKAMAGAPHETLLVIDATMGQNALAQAREFKEALPLSGIVLTKLDGTAKGGMVVGICDALKVPIKMIGLGERQDDLHEFVAEDFVEALLGKGDGVSG
ncbi:MAG TPA: signal recognition particle-docking protein FtsY [Polyangiaceae bacterium]|nr:signal recognition particle-docking protein FtsY [Polyangiaceae bacterium]